MKYDSSTVFAPSTPLGGAIAMLRISGGETARLLKKFFVPQAENAAFSHRRMTYARLTAEDGALIDECSAVYYAAPNSYTGEDMAEVFLHGSQAVMNACLALLSRQENCRPAEAGEFTKRAFLNGKLDLTGAEAVMDMISASTELSRRAAAYQLEGGLRRRADALYDALADAASYMDAVIDYPDEMGDELVTERELRKRLSDIEKSLDALIKNGLASRVLREGARVVIMGEPNSGKSSLLNALLMRDRAIVTKLAGTTRDTIEEKASVNGVPVTYIDTAGIRSANDEAESIGIARAWRECEAAELILWLHPMGEKATEYEKEAFGRLKNAVISVFTKADLFAGGEYNCLPCENMVCVSSVTGEGLEELKGLISSLLHPTDELAIVTNTRHISALKDAASSVKSAIKALEAGLGLDCCATDITEAMNSIGSITGRSASEDVIESIFSRFCVGK